MIQTKPVNQIELGQQVNQTVFTPIRFSAAEDAKAIARPVKNKKIKKLLINLTLRVPLSNLGSRIAFQSPTKTNQKGVPLSDAIQYINHDHPELEAFNQPTPVICKDKINNRIMAASN